MVDSAVAHLMIRPGSSPVAPGRAADQPLSLHWPGNLFPRSPFNVTPTYVQISPDDERLYAGEVTITPDSRSRYVEISGELFALRPKTQEPRTTISAPRADRSRAAAAVSFRPATEGDIPSVLALWDQARSAAAV